jgi:lipopolysaccharide export system protein LptA
MKDNNKWHIAWAAGIAAAISLSTLMPGKVLAQEAQPERKGILSRLLQNNRSQNTPAPQQRTEIDTTRTEASPAPVTARPVAKPAAPAPKPAPAASPKPAAGSTEPVARERGPGEVPVAAPVATPVASRPPAAVAEPVARPVPGAAQTMQSPESKTPSGASPAAAAKDSPISLLANAEAPEPQDLKPKFSKADPPSDKGPVMEITSDESVLHNQSDERMVEFTGDVVLNHPAFNLTSDRLDVFLNDEEEGGTSAANPASGAEGGKKPPFKRAVATGSMVKIERINPSGEVEIAFARRADFDGITGDVVLSGGPPELQTGKIHVNPTGTNAKIYLLANGKYTVDGNTEPATGKQGRSVIEIPVKGDNATKAPGFLPTQLNDVKSERSRE